MLPRGATALANRSLLLKSKSTVVVESVDVEAVDSEVVVVDVESEVPGELPVHLEVSS